MAFSAVQCAHCGLFSERRNGDVNRARKLGLPLYCDKDCAGKARRAEKTAAQKVEEKRLYDMQYRANNLTRIKQDKAQWFRRTYDPVAAAVARKERMPAHVEYCRRPEYKKWKREYDERYRAKKEYGEFWQCFLIVTNIAEEVAERASKTEIATANGTLNKAQTRKRDYERAYSNQP